jgi:hypothetical protein
MRMDQPDVSRKHDSEQDALEGLVSDAVRVAVDTLREYYPQAAAALTAAAIERMTRQVAEEQGSDILQKMYLAARDCVEAELQAVEQRLANAAGSALLDGNQ